MRTKAQARPRLRDRLIRSSAECFVGRERDLAAIVAELAPDGAAATFVHGMGGIGKSSLLDAVAPRLEARGARVVRIDGRTVEPTVHGFLDAFRALLGRPAGGRSRRDASPRGSGDDLEELARRIDAIDAPVAVLVDEYDRLLLLDAWLRQSLLPALPDRTRWIFAGRFAPSPSWLSSPGWAGAVRSLRLDALPDAEGRALLAARGVARSAMAPILRLARGSPLALELAARATPGPDDEAAQLDGASVLEHLARRAVDDTTEADLRSAIDALAVVRCGSRPLLEAMLDRACDGAFLRRLGDLPFVDYGPHGLVLHEAVRHAVVGRLAAVDPGRLAALRAAAWRSLEPALQSSPARADAWRTTADVLFLVAYPAIREAFFPTAMSSVFVEAALASDERAIASFLRRRDLASIAPPLRAWWRHAPWAFRVARTSDGKLVGFAAVSRSAQVPAALRDADPLVRAWHDHLEAGPGRDRGALFVRQAISASLREESDEARAALWIDIKRSYVESPGQWAVYTATRDAARTLRNIEPFGFRLAEPAAGKGAAREQTLILEFGERGIWTWLRRLVGGGAPSPTPDFALDESARGLVVDGVPVPLTALEYGVASALIDAHGAVVTREALLEKVWRQRFTGSNVVDAVVRLLRKKLGPRAALLETVKGHGYRLWGQLKPV
jgi:hypothetical protein